MISIGMPIKMDTSHNVGFTLSVDIYYNNATLSSLLLVAEQDLGMWFLTGASLWWGGMLT